MRIAIAGLGTVGAEVARRIATPPPADSKAPALSKATADSKATATAPENNALQLVAVSARDAGKDRGIDFARHKIDFTDNAVSLATRDDVDCVVELIGGEDGAAKSLVEAAIKSGKHVVTANKALLAKHGVALATAAEAQGVALMGEASVAGGIPCLKMLREGLAANRIHRIAGILNGTCNFILTEMEKRGSDFDATLAEAQRLGYAEADPGFDIDGIDAAQKLAILAAIGFGIAPDTNMIETTGITAVDAVDFTAAAELGFVIRLLGVAERGGRATASGASVGRAQEHGGFTLTVRPTMIPAASQLAKVDGALNAVAIEADPVGSIIAIGPGAGAGATASAVLADLHEVARIFGHSQTFLPGDDAKTITRIAHEVYGGYKKMFEFHGWKMPPGDKIMSAASTEIKGHYGSVKAFKKKIQKAVCSVPNFFGVRAGHLTPTEKVDSDTSHRFYMRLTVTDRPGVLAEITAALGEHKISVESILQHGSPEGGSVPVIITTHAIAESALTETAHEISRLDAVLAKPTLMAIADTDDG